MDLPLNGAQAQDNFKLQNEVTQLFMRGDLKWNTGKTTDEKNEGLVLYIQGLKIMQQWISKEQEELKVKRLTELYNAKYADTKQKTDQLEKWKKGHLPEAEQLQQQQKQPEEEQKQIEIIFEDIKTEIPNVQWTDIYGLNASKDSLKEAVILPIKFPQLFGGRRQPWRTIIIYGPSGTGKTLLTQACASEVGGNCFQVSASEIIKKYAEKCENLIKTLFNMAQKNEPSVIFIDDIDFIGQCENRRLITEFLVQMQILHQNNSQIVVVGITNQPWYLGGPIRRRFDKWIYITLPDAPTRAQMMRNILNKTMNVITQDEFDDLVTKTDGYSGSDINILAKDVINDHKIPDVSYNDFILGLNKSKRTVSIDQVQQFEQWKAEFDQGY